MSYHMLLRNNFNAFIIFLRILGIGDWGLGIGPIPNPQSPIPKLKNKCNNNYLIINSFAKLIILLMLIY